MVKIAYVFANGDEAIVVLENDDVYSIGTYIHCSDPFCALMYMCPCMRILGLCTQNKHIHYMQGC